MLSLGRTLADVEFRMASAADRERIYEIRHDVYARELRQHPVNREARLHDALDGSNEYVVAAEGDDLLGFVAITPPSSGSYSIDKYLDRASCPFPFDDALYEIRILTVVRSRRGSILGMMLMYGALRWIAARGGRRIVAIGRTDLLDLYVKTGLRPLGRQVRSGALSFELLTGPVARVESVVMKTYGPILRRIAGRLRWNLEAPFLPPAEPACEHGGASFATIGARFDTLERRHEIITADVLDAWFPPAPGVIAALREDPGWLARSSPPAGAEGLIAALSSARGIPAGRIVPGAGSSDLIFRAFRQWLDRRSRVLLPDPVYGEYAHVLDSLIGCRVDRLRLHPEERFRLDPDRLRRAIGDGYDLVVLVNPGNPVGQHLPREALEPIVAQAPRSTRVWIDEAYVDYAGEGESIERVAAVRDNVVVCKSMSKAYALSGLRVAYLVAPERDASELRRWSPPWGVSLPGQIAAVRALEDPEYYRLRWNESAALRRELVARLRDLTDLVVEESVANWVLCTLPPEGGGARDVVRRCRERGLFLRDLTGLSDRFEGRAFRVAVKDRTTVGRMVEILADVVAAERSAYGVRTGLQ